jgi:predicted dehydrogenase
MPAKTALAIQVSSSTSEVPMPDPIRLGIIGTGLIVTAKHWPALSVLQGTFHVTALANRTLARAEALADAVDAATGFRPATYAGYQEMLAQEHLDAVTLALPPALNPKVTEAALTKSCHVLAEKPIAADLVAAAPMISWPAVYGRVLMIAENYRYLQSHRLAADLIKQGVIGQPGTARWSYYNYQGPESTYYRTAWRKNPEHIGGYLSDGGVHHAAVLRMLLGDVDTVIGQVAQLRPDLPPADTLSATLRFRNGVLGTYAVTYALPGPSTALEVAGSSGVLLVSRHKVELWQRDRLVNAWDASSPFDGVVAMYEDFARSIRTGAPSLSPPQEALEDLRLITAIIHSSEAGRPVRLAEIMAASPTEPS